MKSIWRNHLIICVGLGALAIPVYFADRALLGAGGGGNWITLNFRGVFFWTYITFLAIYVTVSSLTMLVFPKTRALRLHLGSTLLSVILLATAVIAYSKLHRLAISRDYRALMASRKPLINVIELKEWRYFPDESDPTEIRVSVVVHQPGRFAGNVTGEQMDVSGSSRTIFESTNRPEKSTTGHWGRGFHLYFSAKIPGSRARR